MAVTNTTTTAKMLMLRLTSSAGPENREALCAIPAVCTLISAVVHITISRTSPATFSAMLWLIGWLSARYRMVEQREQCAVVPGTSGGTYWNAAQPWHSRNCGGMTEGWITAAQGSP
jgi:hypothetical protein